MPALPIVIIDSNNEAHKLLLKSLGNRPDGISKLLLLFEVRKSPNLVTIFYHDARNTVCPPTLAQRSLLTREFSTLEFSHFHFDLSSKRVLRHSRKQHRKGVQLLPKSDQSLQMLHLSDAVAIRFSDLSLTRSDWLITLDIRNLKNLARFLIFGFFIRWLTSFLPWLVVDIVYRTSSFTEF